MALSESTKMILENENVRVELEIPKTEMTIWELRDDLLLPLLCGAGYDQQTVEALFD